MRRNSAGLVIGIGVSVAAIAAGITLLVPQSSPQVDSFGPSLGASSAPTTHPHTQVPSTAGSLPETTPLGTATPSTATATATATPAPLSKPRRLFIPALGIEAPILAVGLDKARAVAVPENIFEVGWYRYSSIPGEPRGSSVLVGHRDGRVDGHGIFYDLGQMSRGDRIRIEHADGSRTSFEVTARQLLPVSAFSTYAPELFDAEGRPRLYLISCGGVYDADRGGYQSNIVITARPVASNGQVNADLGP